MEEVQGYIDHFIFYNKENGYGIIDLSTEKEEVICVGTFQGMTQGENLKLKGEYVEHPVYGRQLKVKTVERIAPEDAYAMERYLGSGALKGVGPALAKRIVKEFGNDSFRVIEEEPELLVKIKGISERKAIEIATQMEEKKEMREAFVFLQQYGISNQFAVKIYDYYGSNLYRVIKENPYRMAEEIEGIGFKRADEIASKIGIQVDSVYRIRCGILYSFSLAEADGHTYLPKEILLKNSAELLEVKEEQIEIELSNLVIDGKMVIKKNGEKCNCYSSKLYYEEMSCAKMLKDLADSFRQETVVEKERMRRRVEDILENLEREQDLELDELQRRAVFEAAENGLFILSGGPGTGKTTTINAIIHYFEKSGLDILLAAPTGRAAKRMTEATGFESKTIHRLLELSGAVEEGGGRARFERNEEMPLETDVVIIDEMSMVDTHLLYALLKAISLGTRLVLVGDVNQLPSVGAGQVLRDLIDSNAFPTVILQKIFRQAGSSDIVMNAHKINKGERIILGTKSRDFLFLKRDYAEVIYKHMIELLTKRLPKYVNATPMQIQVLTPMRKGMLGVEKLNEILQNYLNPSDSRKKEYQYGDTLFREGDKVMQVKNNYQMEWEIRNHFGLTIDKGTGVFNGDTGVVDTINSFSKELIVRFDEEKYVVYSLEELDELELGYAITIHKSQGSEYPAVLIPLLDGPKQLLNRNLLYTAITRAKKCVVIIGSDETVQNMIENGNVRKRFTGLKERIREVKEGI